MKNIVNVYTLPLKANKIKPIDTGTIVTYNMSIAFEEITTKFAKKQDDEVFNWLYKKYKDTDVSKIYVLSRPEFEDFLLKMLPLYMKKEK